MATKEKGVQDVESQKEALLPKEDEEKPPSVSLLKSLLVALLYGSVSTIITLVNKSLFATYEFNYANVLFLAQMVISTVFLYLAKRIKLIDYSDWSWTKAKACVKLSAFFIGMVFFGLVSLRYVSVPMYGTIRKLTIVFVIIQQYFMMHKTEPRGILISVSIMVLGAVIAGYSDLHGSMIGTVLVFLCCVSTAGYTIRVKQVSTDVEGISIFELMLYNNVISIPFVLLYCIGSGELSGAMYDFEMWYDWGFRVVFMLSGSLAFVLNYSIFLSTRVNSPLATTITGDFKNIITHIVGILLFPQDVTLTAAFVTGLVVSTIGGLLYSYVKLKTMNAM